ncbi:MAG: TIR domain-containing protein [Leptolyngbya sp. UWPOB_LEPTO1]|uniref:toll/interleukin-1 receptor domain-containing protein n=1 Tax=Leptolyngbya sp. UWPOB_LEPTO1 TaxID=2815653 RepID=UPI001AD3EF58|nr:TIR domain-containing protein [Leptolyngbya sp. UWPOB_LEPTO1]MBN8559863.1 TIR domain-containing protein [Leptolyngbya sp. UWPOB_LEPTO1]
MRDVFISYSRKDKPFVEKLHQALEAQNRDAWVDWEDIPLSAKWWHEIQRGIEGANTFVFVISRDSVESKVCRDEIDHAVLHNKRLVPIVRRDDFEMAKVHPTLGQHNWLFFRETDDFETGLAGLLKAIETDLEYVRAHTRILERAIEWQEQKRNESFGLKGDDLRSAEAWLIQGETKEPKPTELQQNYIRASRSTEDATVEAKRILEQAVAKAKRVSLLSLLGVGAAISVAAIAIPASWQAQKKAADAQTQMEKANQSLVETQAKEQAANQKAQVAQQQFEQAQKQKQAAETQAKQAAEKTRVAQQQARVAAQQLAQVNQEKAVAAEEKARAEQQLQVAQGELDRAQAASIVAQQKTEQAEREIRIAADKRNTIVAANGLEKDGVAALKRFNLEKFRGLVDAMRTSDQLQSLMKTKGRDGFAASPIYALQTILDTVENRFQKFHTQMPPLAHESSVNAAQFSPDGQRIVTASGDKTARVWDARTGQEIAKLSGHESIVIAAQFSPDGQRIVTASADKTAMVVPVEDLDALLARGCRWLTNYLIINPQFLKQLPTCQQPALLLASSATLVTQSETAARAGKLQEATEGLTLAKQWNPNLSFDSQKRVQTLANAGQLLREGDRLVKEGKTSEAIAKYRQAQAIDESLKFDPEIRAKKEAESIPLPPPPPIQYR